MPIPPSFHSRSSSSRQVPSLFVGNFDFEHRLACRSGSLPKSLSEVNARLAPAWFTIAEPGDAVWIASEEAADELARLAEIGLPRVQPVCEANELHQPHRPVFWGENDWAVEFTRQWELTWHGCDPFIVRHVNSRRFKHQLEMELGVALGRSVCVASVDELKLAVAELADRGWVLKGEFGGAGREVRFGAGHLSAADVAWASNRFRSGLVVTIEPRLERVDEAGLQFQIHPDGRVEFLGVTPLLTRSNGGYVGSGFREDPSLIETWQEAIAVCSEAAKCVAAEGYFGPLGIDAMRYRDAHGETRTRAIQDLNARFTMGRLALGLRRFPALATKFDWTFRPSELTSQAGGLPPA